MCTGRDTGFEMHIETGELVAVGHGVKLLTLGLVEDHSQGRRGVHDGPFAGVPHSTSRQPTGVTVNPVQLQVISGSGAACAVWRGA